MPHVLGDQAAQMPLRDSREQRPRSTSSGSRVYGISPFVQYIGESRRHAPANAGFTQHADDAAGHVFTAVVADALLR